MMDNLIPGLMYIIAGLLFVIIGCFYISLAFPNSHTTKLQKQNADMKNDIEHYKGLYESTYKMLDESQDLNTHLLKEWEPKAK